ncbi:hypothetical protein KIW84_076685 [Lathyrus oleraceus]|uniref:Uncharacterized protein n=2 Tax=Pisum sativum TaxID=3888 RepID=A0A9D4VX68_PEA|nr:hypothetical protein KIW84_076685 [Pisum sativum]
MDGASTKKSKMMRSASENVSKVDSRKSKFAIKGSKLALTDPKRARRILRKRKFFERLREKESNRYLFNLEKRVATLQKIADRILAFNSKQIRNIMKHNAKLNKLRLKVQTAMELNRSREIMLNAMKEEIKDILRLQLLKELGHEYNDETMHDDEEEEEDEDKVMEDDEEEEEEDEDEVMEDDEEEEDE